MLEVEIWKQSLSFIQSKLCVLNISAFDMYDLNNFSIIYPCQCNSDVPVNLNYSQLIYSCIIIS